MLQLLFFTYTVVIYLYLNSLNVSRSEPLIGRLELSLSSRLFRFTTAHMQKKYYCHFHVQFIKTPQCLFKTTHSALY